jgi:hypothetical protein
MKKKSACKDFVAKLQMNRAQSEAVRQRIDTSRLINRLQNFALGEKVKINGRMRKLLLSSDEIRTAFGLLSKVLPDLNRVEHTGADGGPIETQDITTLTDGQLLSRIEEIRARGTRASRGTPEAPPGPSELN